MFCQNWDISKSRVDDRLTSEALPRNIASTALKTSCKGIAFTYNDPVIFAEYAIDTAISAHELGLKTVAVTAGYISPCSREEFYEHIDAANIDLKSFTQEFYGKVCLAKLQPVLETLIWLKNKTNVWIEITTLIIPDHNDSNKEITELSKWILDNLGPDVPLHFTAFHPDFKMMDVAPTQSQTLTRARNIAIDCGLNFVYTGNVYDLEGQSTYCSSCKKLLIVRNWYVLGKWNIDRDGCCNYCKAILPGYFESEPGDWGAKRVPVEITPN